MLMIGLVWFLLSWCSELIFIENFLEDFFTFGKKKSGYKEKLCCLKLYYILSFCVDYKF